MGQLFLYDWLSGHNSVEDFSLFNFDDIDSAFEKVQQVKYSQTVSAIFAIYYIYALSESFYSFIDIAKR